MIDGQQRVTALMTAIVGMKVLDKDFKEKVHKIAFNPFAQENENCFEVQDAAILKDKKWITDISELFKTDFDQFTFIEEDFSGAAYVFLTVTAYEKPTKEKFTTYYNNTKILLVITIYLRLIPNNMHAIL